MRVGGPAGCQERGVCVTGEPGTVEDARSLVELLRLRGVTLSSPWRAPSCGSGRLLLCRTRHMWALP